MDITKKLLLILFLFVSCDSFQRINYNEPNNDLIQLTNEKIDKNKSARKRILYNAFKRYTEVADFLSDKNKVTEETIWNFKEMFENSAIVWNDIQLYDGAPQLIDAEVYADLVGTYMSLRGIITEFEKPDINSFFKGTEEQFSPKIDEADENDDIFYYSYKTVKKNFNILNKNNHVLYYDEPMIYPIEITFRISINQQRADIVSILPY